MKYLIIGAILSLAGVWVIANKNILVGIIVLLLGAAIGLKGRQNIDKNKL